MPNTLDEELEEYGSKFSLMWGLYDATLLITMISGCHAAKDLISVTHTAIGGMSTGHWQASNHGILEVSTWSLNKSKPAKLCL